VPTLPGNRRSTISIPSLCGAAVIALLSVTAGAAAQSPNVVEGKVTTVDGKPVAGATIRIAGAVGAARGTSRKATTDANGRYRISVPPGHYNVDGFADIEYNGQTYRELWLDRGTATCERVMSDKGIVRNFVLRLSGAKRCTNGFNPDNPADYYGAYISINTDAFPADAAITFTLTLLSPLADGTVGREVTFVRTGQALAKGGGPIGQTGFLHDIPLGRYRIEANVAYTDGTQRGTLLTLQDGSGKTASTLDIDFPANVFGGGIRALNLGVKAGEAGTVAADAAVEPIQDAPKADEPAAEAAPQSVTSPAPSQNAADLPTGRYLCSYRSQYAGDIPTGKSITILGGGRYEAFNGSGRYAVDADAEKVTWSSGPLSGKDVTATFGNRNGRPAITVVGGAASEDPDGTNFCMLTR